MWAQLIEMRLREGREPEDTIRSMADVAAAFRAAEQPGSGLVRSQFMRDQADPSRIISLVVFESEEQARAREQDPRRAERLAEARSMMAELFEGPPTFTDLEIVEEWTDAST
jgi:heme-degrading monooxygenase HmoA